MLAAAPDRDSALGLFQVVLRSVDTNPAVEVSDSLKGHIVLVLRSALEIASNPKAIKADTPPEAIELALQIRGQEELKDRISRIASFDNIRADFARELLQSIHSLAA